MSHAQIIALTDLKGYLNITTDDEDASLDPIVRAANATVERECDRTFKTTAYADEVYDGNNSDQLVLRNYPVTLLSAVKYGLTSPFSTVDAADYVFSSEGIITLINGGIFDKIPRYWRITYTAGYSDTNMPSDLKWAVAEIGAFLYKMKIAGRIGITSKTAGGQVVESYLQNFPAHVGDVLSRYKRKIFW
jgi:uncharacterized phiE125 gp8 family phage protein